MTRFGLRAALAELGRAQKSSAGASLYSRHINRPLGRFFAAAAAAIGLSPNAVTALSAAATTGGILLLALSRPSWFIGIVVAALLVLGFALDSADGQLARLTGHDSAAGEWLDHVVDSGKMVAVHAGVLVAAYRNGLLVGGWLLVPIAYMFVAVVLFSAMTIFVLLQRVAARTDATVSRPPSTVRAVGLLPADYGVLALSFLLWGAPTLFFAAYGGLLVLTGLITGALLVKWFRTLAATK